MLCEPTACSAISRLLSPLQTAFNILCLATKVGPGPSFPAMRSISSVESFRALQISSRSESSPGQPELIIPSRNSTCRCDSSLRIL